MGWLDALGCLSIAAIIILSLHFGQRRQLAREEWQRRYGLLPYPSSQAASAAMPARQINTPWPGSGFYDSAPAPAPILVPQGQAETGGLISAASIIPSAVDWLWPGMIAQGALTLIAGKPGMGKSQLAIAVAATVSRGGAWPDGTATAPGSVILCETEDDQQSVILPRLIAAGSVLPRVAVGGRYDFAEGLDKLRAHADSMHDLRLLVLSPVVTFFGEGGSMEESAVRARLDPLLAWAASRKVAVLGIAHLKDGGAMDEFAGSKVFKRVARAAWTAVADPKNPAQRMLVAAKNNLGSDQRQIRYRIEGMTLPGGIQTSRVAFQAAPREK